MPNRFLIKQKYNPTPYYLVLFAEFDMIFSLS